MPTAPRYAGQLPDYAHNISAGTAAKKALHSTIIPPVRSNHVFVMAASSLPSRTPGSNVNHNITS